MDGGKAGSELYGREGGSDVYAEPHALRDRVGGHCHWAALDPCRSSKETTSHSDPLVRRSDPQWLSVGTGLRSLPLLVGTSHTDRDPIRYDTIRTGFVSHARHSY